MMIFKVRYQDLILYLHYQKVDIKSQFNDNPILNQNILNV